VRVTDPENLIQVGFKFLVFKKDREGEIKRNGYTAIDYTTMIRALEVYDPHTQQNTMEFFDYVVMKLPFPFLTREERTSAYF
jgi:hypothetical protein